MLRSTDRNTQTVVTVLLQDLPEVQSKSNGGEVRTASVDMRVDSQVTADTPRHARAAGPQVNFWAYSKKYIERHDAGLSFS